MVLRFNAWNTAVIAFFAFLIYYGTFPMFFPVGGLYYAQALIIIAFVLFVFLTNRERWVLNRTAKQVFFFWLLIYLWGRITLSWAVYESTAREYLLHVFVMLVSLLLFAWMSSGIGWDILGRRAFILVGLAFGLVGIYEAFTGDYHFTLRLGYTAKSYFGLHLPMSVFYNPNDHVTFVTMVWFLSVLETADMADAGKKKKQRLVCAIIFGINVLLSNSRGAWGASILFFSFYFLAKSGMDQRWTRIFFAILAFALLYDVLLDFLLNTVFKQKGLDTGRDWIWEESWKNFVASGYLGNGPGNTALLNSAGEYKGGYHLHNFFLEYICDYGIPGFVCSVGWVLSLLFGAFRMRNEHEEKSAIMLATMIGFAPLSVTPATLIAQDWIYFYIALFVAEINRFECRQERRVLEDEYRYRNDMV